LNTREDGATRELAGFISRAVYDDLPAEVIAKAKDLICDQLGVAVACSTLSWNRKVLDYVKDMGIKGNSTVIGDRYKTSLEYAALVNGTFGHGFELDDYCSPTGAHVGCVVIPAALGVGAQSGANGREFLTAVALGAEMLHRLGLGLTTTGVAARGFHSTSVYGPFGAAACAGSLLKLDPEQMTYALGIAGSHCSGTTEYDQTGGDTKRLHAGIAAMAGVRSAQLAKNGFTAPPTILEGKNGILNAFSDSPDPDKLTESLGDEFFMLKARIKPYACCGAIIPHIDALREILEAHPVSPSEVKSIRMGTENRALSHVGTVGPEPEDVVGAQFSAHFSLGLTLVKGSNDFQTYHDAMTNGFKDEEVLAVARKVTVQHDDEAEAIFPSTRLGKISLETTDGQQYSAKVLYPKGSPENPLSHADLSEKFLGLARMVLPDDQTRALLATIEDLEALSDVSDLSQLLTPRA